jgi:hypothetical protein
MSSPLTAHPGFRLAIAALGSALLLAPAAGLASDLRDQLVSPTPACGKDLNYLVGTWDIEATEPGAKEPVQFQYEVRPLVGTAWIAGRGKAKKGEEESSDVWGLDASTGEIMRVIFDKSGTYALMRGSGWQDGRLVLNGEARSARGTIKVRETISCIDQNRFNARWEAFLNGTWSAYSDEDVVRRQS